VRWSGMVETIELKINIAAENSLPPSIKPRAERVIEQLPFGM